MSSNFGRQSRPALDRCRLCVLAAALRVLLVDPIYNADLQVPLSCIDQLSALQGFLYYLWDNTQCVRPHCREGKDCNYFALAGLRVSGPLAGNPPEITLASGGPHSVRE
jgi:hypothetical protein